MLLSSHRIYCPYCGEGISILIDDSASEQDYYEDCPVCCRPIRVQLLATIDGECELQIKRDDE